MGPLVSILPHRGQKSLEAKSLNESAARTEMQTAPAAEVAKMANEHPTGGERPKLGDDIPDEETGQFGDATDPGLESDEDLDGEQDADGGQPLHG